MSATASLLRRLGLARRRVARSIKLRMVLMFLVLAAVTVGIFVVGARQAFSFGWREAARPLLIDYVDRLGADLVIDGRPSIERARALADRLPLTVRIDGPAINWSSHPETMRAPTGSHWTALLTRTSPDGHRMRFGIDEQVFERRPHRIGLALLTLLGATLLAWLYLRRLLKPLDAIGDGARRFGQGDFSEAIPIDPKRRHDELGELAGTINTMGHDIGQMLDAKRALLLAISHELRSPLTRARLNAELLPDNDTVQPQREALLHDLKLMGRLISDLLESERLAGPHAGLHREPVDLPALAREVLDQQARIDPSAAQVRLFIDGDIPTLSLDPARMHLLLSNLVDNALHHAADAPSPPELHVCRGRSAVIVEVRDYGPGVDAEQLRKLAEPFYRPDSARGRDRGGVGLGLYLCRLVAQAHGAHFEIANAQPGLRVSIRQPLHATKG